MHLIRPDGNQHAGINEGADDYPQYSLNPESPASSRHGKANDGQGHNGDADRSLPERLQDSRAFQPAQFSADQDKQSDHFKRRGSGICQSQSAVRHPSNG